MPEPLAADSGQIGSCVARAPSICFRAGGPDDLGPFLGFGRQERPEVFAEGRARFRPKLADARDHVRRLERFGDFVPQSREHRLRRLRRSTRPYQEDASKPGRPCSATVGTSGSADGRFAPALASARTLLAATCGNTTGMRSKNIWTWPAMRSFIAGPAPRYGTCTISMLAMLLNSSPER